MSGETLKDLEEIEEQLLQDYESLIVALEKMKPVYEPNPDIHLKGTYENETRSKDERKIAGIISEVTGILQKVGSNLETSQQRTKEAIYSTKETMVTVPASNLNETIYKQTILENIQKNLETLLK